MKLALLPLSLALSSLTFGCTDGGSTEPALPSCIDTYAMLVEACQSELDAYNGSRETTRAVSDCLAANVPDGPEDACGGECPVDPAQWWDRFVAGYTRAFSSELWMGDVVPLDLDPEVQCHPYDAWANERG